MKPALRLTIAALAVLVGIAILAPTQTEATPPFKEICHAEALRVEAGAVPPGDQGSQPCKHPGGCLCKYDKCLRADPARPARPVVVAKNVDCSTPAVKISNPVPPGCKVQNATVDPNKSWNGATCKSPDGCTCYVTVCISGGKVSTKDAKCIGLPH